jgi:uncharacterized protein
MRKSLDHLPAGKRRELAFVVEVLTSAFAEAMASRRDVADSQILKIILFGSYARGDWVEDPIGRYFSDYDLLVVVNDEKLTDMLDVWEGAEKKLLAALSSGQHLRTPVGLIVHTLDDVNAQLSQGRYFFVDIARDGIALLDVSDQPFLQAQPLPTQAALEQTLEEYTRAAGAAEGFLDTARYVARSGRLTESAFQLHQAAEQAYTCLLLVETLYTPKSHNLVRLRQLAEPLDERLRAVWPTSTKFEKRCFELLRAAYVKARYSRHYKISREELDWLAGRIEVLRELVEDVCQARIAELRWRAQDEGD